MKKVYDVLIYRCDACEGKFTWKNHEYVITDNIEGYVEKRMTEIEAGSAWWMDHEQVYGGKNDGRPKIKFEEIEIIEY